MKHFFALLLSALMVLSLLTACLFLAMAVLDHARARILARIGAAIQGRLDARVFSAALHRRLLHPSDPTAATAQRDLESVQRLYASPLLTALFDMLWTPVFAAAIFLFHPALGWLAVTGGAVLIAATLLNQRLTQAPQNRATALGLQADQAADQIVFFARRSRDDVEAQVVAPGAAVEQAHGDAQLFAEMSDDIGDDFRFGGGRQALDQRQRLVR